MEVHNFGPWSEDFNAKNFWSGFQACRALLSDFLCGVPCFGLGAFPQALHGDVDGVIEFFSSFLLGFLCFLMILRLFYEDS